MKFFIFFLQKAQVYLTFFYEIGRSFIFEDDSNDRFLLEDDS